MVCFKQNDQAEVEMLGWKRSPLPRGAGNASSWDACPGTATAGSPPLTLMVPPSFAWAAVLGLLGFGQNVV